MKRFKQHIDEANRRSNVDLTVGQSKVGMGKGAVNSPRVVHPMGSSQNVARPSPGLTGTPSGPAVRNDFERFPYPAAVARAKARDLRTKIMNTKQSVAKQVGPTQTASQVKPKLQPQASPNLNTVKASSQPPASVTKGNYVNQAYPQAAAVKNAYNVNDKGPTSTVKAKTGVGTSPPKGVEMVDPLRSTPKEILQVWKDYQRGKKEAFQKSAKTISKAAAPVLQKAREYLGTDKPVAPEKAPLATALLGKDGGPKSSVKTAIDKPAQASEVPVGQAVQAGPAPSKSLKANPPEFVKQGVAGISNAAQLAAKALGKTVGPGKSIDVRQQPTGAGKENSGITDTSRFWSKATGNQPFNKDVPAKVQTQAKQGTLNKVNPTTSGIQGPAGSPSGSRARPSPNLGSSKNTGAQVPGPAGSPSGPSATSVKPSMPIPTPKPTGSRVTASTPAPSTNAKATRQRGVRRTRSAPSRKSNWGFHGTATGTAGRGMSAGAITNRALGGVYEEKVPEIVKESFESFIRNKFLKGNNEKK